MKQLSTYCVKCRKNTLMIDPKVEKTKNGRLMLVGKCGVCGTKKTRFIKKSDVQQGGFIFSLLGNLLKPIFG